MSKGLSSVKTLSAKEIAKKWNLPLSVVAKKIAAGVKVEKEHTKSTSQANEIARDHLGERPDYYDKLGKMEKQPVVKEESGITGVAGVAGLGYNTGVPAIDDDNEYINTNALARDFTNGAIMDFINKHHHRLHDKTSFKQYDAKKLKTSSNKDLAESLGSDYGTSAVPIIGDLTGTSRKVTKVDEVKLPAKARKAVATGMTIANLYTAGDVASRAQQGIGSPVKDIVAAASTLPGTKGWTAYGADKARQAYEYIKGKRMKENKNLVPANTVERGIYEATFQGKTVPLNKPMKGDVKKSKVYVDPDGDGKAQKVNFGDPNMTIKKSNPARRKSFRARHNCDNPGPKTKARYWSCRAWEETELFETTLRKKIKYAIKAAGQQTRIAKELRPDEVESDKTYQKRKKGLDRVFKEEKKVQGYQNWPGEKKKKFFSGPKDDSGKTETQKWAERRQKEREAKKEKLDEITVKQLTKQQQAAKKKEYFDAAVEREKERKLPKFDRDENQKKHSEWRKKKGVEEQTQINEFDTSSLPMSRNIEDRRKGSAAGGATPQNLETPTTAMGVKGGSTSSSTSTPSNTGPSGRSFPLDKQGKLDRVELRKQTDSAFDSKTPSQMNEISAELVGKISNARFWRGEAPSKTLSRAINKKYIESGQKKEKEPNKTNTKEETTMDTKDLINEALDNILEENLVAMKENLQTALQEKMMEKLEERKKIIASEYFAQ